MRVQYPRVPVPMGKIAILNSATIASAAGSRAMPVQLENSTIVDTNGCRRGIRPAKREAAG
jgi:hypothetical protein